MNDAEEKESGTSKDKIMRLCCDTKKGNIVPKG